MLTIFFYYLVFKLVLELRYVVMVPCINFPFLEHCNKYVNIAFQVSLIIAGFVLCLLKFPPMADIIC